VAGSGSEEKRDASYEEIAQRLREIPLGTRISVGVDEVQLAGIASWIGWFAGATDAGRDGVWFQARDGGVPPTMLGFSIWRRGFATGSIGPFHVGYRMRDVAVGVEWGFDEYPRMHDPLPDWSAPQERESEPEREPFVPPTPKRPPRPGQPMALSFKVEDELPDGRRIGPVGTWLEDDPTAGWVEVLGWMSEDDARTLAQKYGFAYHEE
jgi:hypothetical protein